MIPECGMVQITPILPSEKPERRWHRDILQGIALVAGTGDIPDMCPVHAPICV